MFQLQANRTSLGGYREEGFWAEARRQRPGGQGRPAEYSGRCRGVGWLARGHEHHAGFMKSWGLYLDTLGIFERCQR